jgi:anti-sigma regulatory factor (Ser/Thr protein kinase)
MRAELVLPADSSAPRAARQMLRSFGVPSPHAELVVSELVTNALVHGASPIALTLERIAGTVRIEVRDERHDFGPTTEQSRGLQIVDACSLGWGIDPIPHNGKIVWANVTP